MNFNRNRNQQNQRELLRHFQNALRNAENAGDEGIAQAIREKIEALKKARPEVMEEKSFLNSIGNSVRNLIDWGWGSVKQCVQFVVECLQQALDLIMNILGGLVDCFAVA